MSIDKTKDKRPVLEILEDARRRVVHCMKSGKRLCILLENAVPDFATTFNDESSRGETRSLSDPVPILRSHFPFLHGTHTRLGEVSPIRKLAGCEKVLVRIFEYVEESLRVASFPLEVFCEAGRVIAQPPWPRRLFREADLEAGLAIPRIEPTMGNPGFAVVVTTRFRPDEFEDYLFKNEWGLPKPTSMYQAIIIEYDEDVPLIP